MFLRSYINEWRKLRRSMIWLAVFILPLVSVLMGTGNYAQNTGILQSQWYSLWTQVCLFYSYFFFPALIGIYSAYLCRLEHLHHNWNTILTVPIPLSHIYLSKLAIIASLTLITQIFLGLLYLLAGNMLPLQAKPPIEVLRWLLGGWCASVVIGSFQLCLSLFIHNFALPVGIALAGGIGGLLLLAKGYGLYFPFSLLAFGMSAVHPTETLPITIYVQFTCSCLCFLFLFSYVGIGKLKKSDIS